MFCEDCGTKLHSTANYCPKCGNKISKPAKAPLKITILNGLDTHAKRAQKVNPGAPIIHYLMKLASFDVRSLELPVDTEAFIFKKGFKSSFNLGVDSVKLGRLAEDEMGKFIKEATPKMDNLTEQLMLIGYILRIVSQNEMRNNLKYDGAKSPKAAIDYLLSLPPVGPFDFSEESDGFSLPWAATYGFDRTMLIELITKNIKKAFPGSVLFSEQNIPFLLTVGWQLARFDIFRKKISYID